MEAVDDDDAFFEIMDNTKQMDLNKPHNSLNTNNSNNRHSKSPSISSQASGVSGGSGSGSGEFLKVSIVDATTDVTKINFRVQTSTNLTEFQCKSSEVTRQHEDFIWLHQTLSDSTQYAGYLIPPPPPYPDFSTSREKYDRYAEVQMRYNKLTSNQKPSDPAHLQKQQPTNSRTLQKLKKDCEAEYLASFKKCVSSHEQFLKRLTHHTLFRKDVNLRLFLECKDSLKPHMASTSGQGKGMFGGFFNKAVQFSDEYIFRKMASSNSMAPVPTDQIQGGGDTMQASIHSVLPQDEFSRLYVYFTEKLKELSKVNARNQTIVHKEKSVGNYADWLNELLVQVNCEQKLTENSCKSSIPQLEVLTLTPRVSTSHRVADAFSNPSSSSNSSAVFNQSTSPQRMGAHDTSMASSVTSAYSSLYSPHTSPSKIQPHGHLVLTSLLPAIVALHKAMLVESRAQNKAANDFDLHFNLAISTAMGDMRSGKALLYRRMKVHERLVALSEKIERSTDVVTVKPYELEVMKQRRADLENQFHQYNTIGSRELRQQQTTQARRLPLNLKEHAMLQERQHRNAAKEIMALLEKF